MLVLVVVGLITLAGIGLATATQEVAMLQVQLAEKLRTQVSRELEQNVAMYRDFTGDYPESLEALGEAPGFKHVRVLSDTVFASVGYRLAPGTVSDSQRTGVSRVALYTVKPGVNRELKNADIFDADKNSCKSGDSSDFATASSWCPPVGSTLYHATLDSRLAKTREQAAQHTRMVRTLHRFARFQRSGATWSPNYDAKGNPLLDGTEYVLATIATAEATPPTAKDCHGTDFALTHQDAGKADKAMPLGCEDLFDVWGGEIRYKRNGSTAVQIISITPFRDEKDAPVVKSLELELPRVGG